MQPYRLEKLVQDPSGDLTPFESKEEMERVQANMEALTGNQYPTFEVDEVLDIKGGKFKVTRIMSRGRMVLKGVAY